MKWMDLELDLPEWWTMSPRSHMDAAEALVRDLAAQINDKGGGFVTTPIPLTVANLHLQAAAIKMAHTSAQIAVRR